MKKVIYWFAFILSIEILLVSIFELAGGSFNIIMPPANGEVIAFAAVTLAICLYSGINLMRFYKHNK